MNEQLILKYLHKSGIISDELFEKINSHLKEKLFSVHYELRMLLYLGVLMLTSGLGILIYKNYEAIGHNVIVAGIGLICFGCLGYCFFKRHPFSNQQVQSQGIVYDYIALLGCLTFGIFIGYLQFQYKIFGEYFGLTALVPCLVFFICAYLFDHKGILSLAIAGLYAYAGISLAPKDVMNGFDYSTSHYIYAGFVLGILLFAIAFATRKYDFKKHFEYTYYNFAVHTLFIASLTGLFNEGWKIIYFLMLALLVFFVIRNATKEKSFYFFLMAVIYGYVGTGYLLINAMNAFNFYDSNIYFIYFILSGTVAIKLINNFRKKIKTDDAI